MGSEKEGVLVSKRVATHRFIGIVTAKFWFSDELKAGIQSLYFRETDFVVGSWRENEEGSAYPIQRLGIIAICGNRADADIIYATRLVAVIPAEKTAMFDWNTLSLDEMAAHLKQRYMMSSSGDAKCIWELVQFYEKHKDDAKNAKMPAYFQEWLVKRADEEAAKSYQKLSLAKINMALGKLQFIKEAHVFLESKWEEGKNGK